MARVKGKVIMGIKDQKDLFGKSTTFFQKLQDEANQTISDKTTSLVSANTKIMTMPTFRHKL